MGIITKGFVSPFIKSVGNVTGRVIHGSAFIQSKRNKQPLSSNNPLSTNGIKINKLARYYSDNKAALEFILNSIRPDISLSYKSIVRSYVTNTILIQPNLVSPLTLGLDQFRSKLDFLCPASLVVDEVEFRVDNMLSIKSMFSTAQVYLYKWQLSTGITGPSIFNIDQNLETFGYQTAGLSSGQYNIGLCFVYDPISGYKSQASLAIYREP